MILTYSGDEPTYISLAKKTGFVYCIDRKRNTKVKKIVRQIPKKIQDIDLFTYEMPFEEGIAASTIRATLYKSRINNCPGY